MIKDPEEGKSKNNSQPLEINRGFELMLRNHERSMVKKSNPWFQLKFEKIFPFFRKEINFFIHLSLDIRKIAQIK